MSITSMLWFERLSGQLKIPWWSGTILVSSLLFVIPYAVFGAFFGFWDFFLSQIGSVVPLVVLVGVYCLFASRYIRRKVEDLLQYCESISVEKLGIRPSALYGFRPVLIVWIILDIVQTWAFFPVYPSTFTVIQRILVQMPWNLWGIALATLFWTFGYSLVTIYRMGKQPLRLKPFTEDRTLGLKPFGLASLRLTLIFVASWAMLTALQLLQGYVQVQILLADVGAFLLGFVIFLLPLFSLRQRLLSAKREKLRWISQRYTRIMQQFEENSDNVDQKLVNELRVVDRALRDIQQISTWPFDTGILVRLLAVILSVVAIILARIVTIALHL